LTRLALTRKPCRRYRPEIERSIDEIPQALRVEIRAVISGEKPWPLFMCGSLGTGKTCAALCLLDYAGGDYYTVPGLCAKLNQSREGHLEWSHEGHGGRIFPEQFWNRFRMASLIVLDEIGLRERASEAQYEAVYTAIEERAFKPLVVCSNLGAGDIERIYDGRIFSRLTRGTVVEIKGPDRRLQ
jgi:DNA replication protein DnaC